MASDKPRTPTLRSAASSVVGDLVNGIASLVAPNVDGQHGNDYSQYVYNALQQAVLPSNLVAMLRGLNTKQKKWLRKQLYSVKYIEQRCIPTEGRTNVELAKLLWQEIGLLLPGFIPTLTALNSNPLLNDPSSVVKVVWANGDVPLRNIAEAQSTHDMVSKERDEWMSLLAHQHQSVKLNQPNEALYNYVYDNASDHAQYWLVKRYGNFPVSLNRGTGEFTPLLRLWPENLPEMVALYGMYPSLDKDRKDIRLSLVTKLKKNVDAAVDNNPTLIGNIFEFMCWFGAEEWNVSRVTALGIPKLYLSDPFVKTKLTEVALSFANFATLKLINFKPVSEINPGDEVAIQALAREVSETRRDMWPYMMTKRVGTIIIPIAMNMLRIPPNEF